MTRLLSLLWVCALALTVSGSSPSTGAVDAALLETQTLTQTHVTFGAMMFASQFCEPEPPKIDFPANFRKADPFKVCCGGMECPYRGGVCCSNGQHCCPVASECLPTLPGQPQRCARALPKITQAEKLESACWCPPPPTCKAPCPPLVACACIPEVPMPKLNESIGFVPYVPPPNPSLPPPPPPPVYKEGAVLSENEQDPCCKAEGQGPDVVSTQKLLPVDTLPKGMLDKWPQPPKENKTNTTAPAPAPVKVNVPAPKPVAPVAAPVRVAPAPPPVKKSAPAPMTDEQVAIRLGIAYEGMNPDELHSAIEAKILAMTTQKAVSNLTTVVTEVEKLLSNVSNDAVDNRKREDKRLVKDATEQVDQARAEVDSLTDRIFKLEAQEAARIKRVQDYQAQKDKEWQDWKKKQIDTYKAKRAKIRAQEKKADDKHKDEVKKATNAVKAARDNEVSATNRAVKDAETAKQNADKAAKDAMKRQQAAADRLAKFQAERTKKQNERKAKLEKVEAETKALKAAQEKASKKAAEEANKNEIQRKAELRIAEQDNKAAEERSKRVEDEKTAKAQMEESNKQFEKAKGAASAAADLAKQAKANLEKVLEEPPEMPKSVQQLQDAAKQANQNFIKSATKAAQAEAKKGDVAAVPTAPAGLDDKRRAEFKAKLSVLQRPFFTKLADFNLAREQVQLGWEKVKYKKSVLRGFRNRQRWLELHAGDLCDARDRAERHVEKLREHMKLAVSHYKTLVDVAKAHNKPPPHHRIVSVPHRILMSGIRSLHNITEICNSALENATSFDAYIAKAVEGVRLAKAAVQAAQVKMLTVRGDIMVLRNQMQQLASKYVVKSRTPSSATPAARHRVRFGQKTEGDAAPKVAAPTVPAENTLAPVPTTTAKPLVLMDGWVVPSANLSLVVPQYQLVGHLCVLQGAVMTLKQTAYTNAIILPEECRPKGQRSFTVAVQGADGSSLWSSYSVRLDIFQDGVVKLFPLPKKAESDDAPTPAPAPPKVAATATPVGKMMLLEVDAIAPAASAPVAIPPAPVATVEELRDAILLSLNGITFPTRDVTLNPLYLSSPWMHAEAPLTPAYFIRHALMCVVGGTVRVPKMEQWTLQNSVIGILDKECIPEETLVFSVNSNGKLHRVDIRPNGHIAWQSGPIETESLSLDGIAFYPRSSEIEHFKFHGQWSSFKAPVDDIELSGNFRQAGWRRVGKLCSLSGLVNGTGKSGDVLTHLAVECRPANRVTYHVNSGKKLVRLDVDPSGSLTYRGPNQTNTWFSLEGVRFNVDDNVASRSVMEKIQDQIVTKIQDMIKIKVQTNAAPDEITKLQNELTAALAKQATLRAATQDTADLTQARIRVAADRARAEQLMISEQREKTSESYNRVVSGLLELNQGYIAWGEPLQAPHYSVIGRMCFLSGAVLATNRTGYITVLPDQCAPMKTSQFVLRRQLERPVFVRVTTGGVVEFVAEAAKPEGDDADKDADSDLLFSLDGIVFPVSGAKGEALSLTNSWAATHSGASIYREGSLCVLSGSVEVKSTAKWSTPDVQTIGSVIELCKPESGYLEFPVNHADQMHIVRLNADGTLVWKRGKRVDGVKTLFLDGIAYSAGAIARKIPLVNGYSWFKMQSHPPTFSVQGQLCVLAGRVSGDGHPQIAQLPESCRPVGGELQFATPIEHRVEILRVLPSGQVFWATSRDFEDGISLDGIRFVRDANFSDYVQNLTNSRIDALNATADQTATLTLGELGPEQPKAASLAPLFAPYTAPYVTKHGQICVVAGNLRARLLRPGTVLAKLPEWCTPRDRLVFSVVVDLHDSARVDVTGDGQIVYVTGKMGNTLSLGGISFPASNLSVTTGRSLKLKNKWSVYGGHAVPAYAVQGDLCVLYGTLSADWSDAISGGEITQLPNDCRPLDGNLVFATSQHGNPQRIDITWDGVVSWAGGVHNVEGKENRIVSLAGITFFRSIRPHYTFAIPLLNDNEPYKVGYRYPSWRRESSLCVLSGVVNASHSVLGRLPLPCRPSYRASFPVSRSSVIDRIDILKNGTIRWVGHSMGSGWLSLDGIRFTVDQKYNNTLVVTKKKQADQLNTGAVNSKPLNITNKFLPFGDGFAPPLYHRVGSLCLLSGVASTADIRSLVTELPEDCRPSAQVTVTVPVSADISPRAPPKPPAPTDKMYDDKLPGYDPSSGKPVPKSPALMAKIMADDDSGRSSLQTARFDVDVSGNVQWTAGKMASWLPLDSVWFPIRNSPTSPMPVTIFKNTWSSAGVPYDQLSFIREGDFCMLSGVVKVPAVENIGMNFSDTTNANDVLRHHTPAPLSDAPLLAAGSSKKSLSRAPPLWEAGDRIRPAAPATGYQPGFSSKPLSAMNATELKAAIRQQKNDKPVFDDKKKPSLPAAKSLLELESEMGKKKKDAKKKAIESDSIDMEANAENDPFAVLNLKDKTLDSEIDKDDDDITRTLRDDPRYKAALEEARKQSRHKPGDYRTPASKMEDLKAQAYAKVLASRGNVDDDDIFDSPDDVRGELQREDIMGMMAGTHDVPEHLERQARKRLAAMKKATAIAKERAAAVAAHKPNLNVNMPALPDDNAEVDLNGEPPGVFDKWWKLVDPKKYEKDIIKTDIPALPRTTPMRWNRTDNITETEIEAPSPSLEQLARKQKLDKVKADQAELKRVRWLYKVYKHFKNRDYLSDKEKKIVQEEETKQQEDIEKDIPVKFNKNLKPVYSEELNKKNNPKLPAVPKPGPITTDTNGQVLIARLPRACAPLDARLMFTVNHHLGQHRVDITADGEVFWVAGTAKQNWVSLDGIGYFVSDGRPLGDDDDGPAKPKKLKKKKKNNWDEEPLPAKAKPKPKPKAPKKKKATPKPRPTRYIRPIMLRPGTEWTPYEKWAICRKSNSRPCRIMRARRNRIRVYANAAAAGAAGSSGGRTTHPSVSRTYVQATDVFGNKYVGSPAPNLAKCGTPKGVPCPHLGDVSLTNKPIVVENRVQMPPRFREVRRRARDSQSALAPAEAPAAEAKPAAEPDQPAAAAPAPAPAKVSAFPTPALPPRLKSLMAPPGELIALIKGFDYFLNGYRLPSWRLQGPLCLLSGSVISKKNGPTNIDKVIAVLPTQCRPSFGRLVFATALDAGTQRVDVDTNGNIIWAESTKNRGIISLDGIHFVVDTFYSKVMEKQKNKTLDDDAKTTNKVSQSLSDIRPLTLAPQWRPWIADAPTANSSSIYFGELKREITCQGLNAELACPIVKGKQSFLHIHSATWGRSSASLCENKGATSHAHCRKEVTALVSKECSGKKACKVAATPKALGNVCSMVHKYLSVSYTCDLPAISAPAGVPRYAAPEYSSVGPFCMWSGGAQVHGDVDKVSRAVTVPSDCKPLGRLSYTAMPSRGSFMRLDFTPINTVDVTASENIKAKSSRLFFNGFNYIKEGTLTKPLVLNLGWTNVVDFTPASYLKYGDLCSLQGLVRIEKVDDWPSDIIGFIPEECRPEKSLVFTIGSHTSVHAVEITSAGQIRWIGGNRDSVYFSLSNIFFFTGRVADIRKPISLRNEWNAKGLQFRAPTWFRQGDVCSLSGVLSTETATSTVIAKVPSVCRPTSILRFTVTRGIAAETLVLKPSGILEWENGVVQAGYLSLDGVTYVAPADFTPK